LPPTAVIDPAGAELTATAGSPMTFSAAKSVSNPPGRPLTYGWQFTDGNGGEGVTMPHTFKAAGKFTVTLTVQDEGVSGAPATTSVTVKALTSVAGAAEAAPKAVAGAATPLPGAARGCATALPSYANATTTCTNGQMALKCAAGWYDANGSILDGCEVRGDNWPSSFATAAQQGVLACGTSKSIAGNTAPAGADDWVQFTLTAACPSVTLSLTGSGPVFYDLIEGGAAPPATAANSHVTGTRLFTPNGAQFTVRIYAPAFATYTLMASATKR